MKELGFTVSVDEIGNIFGLLNLAGESAPLVLTGSHIDSQPRGGCFDGAYGVIAGLDAAVAVRDRLAKQSKASLANLGVVAWMGEEGARFRPLMGSRVYTGARTLQSALDGKDLQGISAREALVS
jgi:beta-ureidopropionase / N-carbamoyl-L-amino-acid hydrolase